MTAVRVGRPRGRTKRQARWARVRRPAALAVFGLVVLPSGIAGLAYAVQVLNGGQAPINFSEWTLALVFFGALAANLLTPGARRNPLRFRGRHRRPAPGFRRAVCAAVGVRPASSARAFALRAAAGRLLARLLLGHSVAVRRLARLRAAMRPRAAAR